MPWPWLYQSNFQGKILGKFFEVNANGTPLDPWKMWEQIVALALSIQKKNDRIFKKPYICSKKMLILVIWVDLRKRWKIMIDLVL